MSAVHYRDRPLIAFPLGRPFLDFRFERFAARFGEAFLKADCSAVHSGDPLRCFFLSLESACLVVLAITCCDRFGGRVASQFLLSFSAIRADQLASELLVWCAMASGDSNAQKQVVSDALSESHLLFRLEAVCRSITLTVDCICDPQLR